MRRFSGVGARRALVLALVLVMSSYVTHAVRTTPSVLGVGPAGKATTSEGGNSYGDQATTFHQERSHAAPEGKEEEQLMLKGRAVTGSRLPDCTHACGPCAPCKRVMVSFRCAEAAESCPIAYRCMCRGRFFRVPTL